MKLRPLGLQLRSAQLRCSRGQRFAFLLAVAFALPSVRPAAAQDAAAPPPQYQAAVDRGFGEFGLGNYWEARASFVEAHKIFPNARSARSLGMVEYELRNYASSIRYLEAALADTRRPLTPEDRAEAEATLANAQRYVARYIIKLTPPDATLRLDDAPAPLGPDNSLLLEVRDYVLVAQAPAYLPVRKRLKVESAGTFHLDIQLPLEAAPGPATSTATRSDSSSITSQWWFWAGIGAVVVAGTSVGLAVGLDASDPTVQRGTTGKILTVEMQ